MGVFAFERDDDSDTVQDTVQNCSCKNWLMIRNKFIIYTSDFSNKIYNQIWQEEVKMENRPPGQHPRSRTKAPKPSRPQSACSPMAPSEDWPEGEELGGFP
jgi:hypothetical protein